jgi:hypothetical protein
MSIGGFSTEALRVMAAKGLSIEDAIEIGEANAVRSSAAIRQQRHRDKRRNERNVTRNVTPPPYENISIPPVSSTPVVSDETTAPVGLKPEHVVEAWNVMAERCGLRVVRKLTPQRRRKIQTRIRNCTIDEFTEAIAAIERSSFLRGENERGWKADFDWALEPKNFTKLIEGTYDR